MTFRVGQDVECVDDSWGCDGNHPKKGARYVVAGISTPRLSFSKPCDHLQFSGFIHHYASLHFRPIVKHKTDISFAHEILRDVSRKETVRA
jgi:hypothetical protein